MKVIVLGGGAVIGVSTTYYSGARRRSASRCWERQSGVLLALETSFANAGAGLARLLQPLWPRPAFR